MNIGNTSLKSKLLKSALTVAILTVCSPIWAEEKNTVQQDTHESPDQKISGIDHQYIDSNVDLKQDFYGHVNGKWLKNVEIPSDMGSWGTFAYLRDTSVQQLHEIIEKLAKKSPIKGSPEQKVASLYESFMDEVTLEQKGLTPLTDDLNRIDQVKTHQDFTKLMAYLSEMGVTTPFDLGILQDFKDSDQMSVMLAQDGLGLPDRDYYLKDDKKLKSAREAYLLYIEKILSLSGDPDAKKKAQDILKLETELAKIQWDNVQNRDLEKIYNVYALNKTKTLSPNFDWATYFKSSGIAAKVKTVVIAQPSFFKGLDSLLVKTPLETWKSYAKFHLVNSNAAYLNKEFAKTQFDFYQKTLRGVTDQRLRWKRGVDLVNSVLGESLGQVYVTKYFEPEKKQHMEHLVNNLLLAFSQNLKELDWMSDETKQQADKKIKNFSVKIGYPNKWRDYSQLPIEPNDLIGNIKRANAFAYEFELNKLGKPVDREEWGMFPQTVNAYYNTASNEIVFPAAILQPPFFNINADDAVNYGAIGAVIGHEISHGFDDQGSRFDANGNMKNWWTKADHQKFKEKTRALVKQYNAYEALPGYFVNGELTLGENIADNSGLAVAYKAYKISLKGQPAPVISGLTGDQRFYMGWAQAWRSKSKLELVLERIKTDSHSPDQIRGNGALVNQDAFDEAFGLKSGDKMYLPKEKRVKIW